jgi:hypothetical protein
MARRWIRRSAIAAFLLNFALWLFAYPGTLIPESLGPNTTRPDQPDRQHNGFQPAGVISAHAVKYPLDTTAEGIIVFAVSLNAAGEMSGCSALTDVPPLTNAAESSLRSWKFMPASFEGTPQSSRMLVAFAFRHAVKTRNPQPFVPVTSRGEGKGYSPVGITAATYADYPSSTIAAGAVVVEDTVEPDGSVGHERVIRGMDGGFVPLAVKAAREWQFEPAMLNGNPATSKIAIAFVFSSRALNPF